MLDKFIEELDKDESTKEFIDSMVQENYDYGGNLDCSFAIEEFLKCKNISSLSDEEFDVLINIVNQNIMDKTEERIRLQAEADERSNEDEYKDQFGDKSAAFWHLFERLLGSSPEYNKLLSDSYREYLEVRKQK